MGEPKTTVNFVLFFFPTCQVRVVRFYVMSVARLLPLAPPSSFLVLLLAGPQRRFLSGQETSSKLPFSSLRQLSKTVGPPVPNTMTVKARRALWTHGCLCLTSLSERARN